MDREAAEREAIELMHPSPALAALMKRGYERARKYPEATRRFSELVNSLPGKSPEEQRAICEEALHVFPDDGEAEQLAAALLGEETRGSKEPAAVSGD